MNSYQENLELITYESHKINTFWQHHKDLGDNGNAHRYIILCYYKIKGIEHFFHVYMALSKHKEGWENSKTDIGPSHTRGTL